MTFWECYLKLCDDAGKAPNTVAKELPVSSATITGWKNGVTPQDRIVRRVAERFDVDWQALKGGEIVPLEANKKSSPDKVSNVETAQMVELIQLFDKAPPELRAAALAVLRSAEAQK